MNHGRITVGYLLYFQCIIILIKKLFVEVHPQLIILINFSYFTMGIELGNLAVLRTFRVLRALKTVAIVPGNVCYALYNLYTVILLVSKVVLKPIKT